MLLAFVSLFQPLRHVLPTRRPLHAKLFLIMAARRGAVLTYALVGSANASRAALSRTVAEGGNVEAGVVLRLDGEVRLRDLSRPW